ncbi:HmuY family protein [Vulgatibacter incomptus]|uniref:Lipoprotein n=1 Tax=Vulgatibacter incomptus TaxID=1391653 RepID=A0A0K1PC33_9BACT|nr:HmuY family protein [Vulgatibacter incomptus]AKU90966.1 hypothetical protein AKJ08_1353 [Vulgatibacter incomptus]
MKRFLFVAIASLAFAACGDDLRDDHPSIDDPGENETGLVDVQEEAGGSFLVRVDATSETDWVFLDIESRKEADQAGPWHLAFRRQNVVANGPAGVGVAWAAGSDPSATEVPPPSSFRFDGPLDQPAAEGAFQSDDAWYAYDPVTHTLTPRSRVYYVYTPSHHVYALVFQRYYDAAGTSGFPTFRLTPVNH